MRTLGYYAIALQTQALGASDSGLGGNALAWIAASSPLSKGVLFILFLFSIASWAVVLNKLWQFRRLERQTSSFLDIFRRSTKFSEVQSVCRSLSHSPLVSVFQAGYAELNTQLRQGDGATNPGGRPAAGQRVSRL